MSEVLWCLFSLAFLLGVWLLCNVMYGRIYGARLRWRYLWAAHGALLFARRFPQWENNSGMNA